MGDSIEDRPHFDERIVNPGEMGSSAGPLPILRAGDQAGADRVEADISDGADEVDVVEYDGGKAALEEVSGPASASVDEVCVSPVGFTDSTAKVVSALRLQDQMDVVGHQAVCPDLDARLQSLFGEQIEVDFVVAIVKEDGLAPVAALRDMVRKPRYDDASESRHGKTIAFIR